MGGTVCSWSTEMSACAAARINSECSRGMRPQMSRRMTVMLPSNTSSDMSSAWDVGCGDADQHLAGGVDGAVAASDLLRRQAAPEHHDLLDVPVSVEAPLRLATPQQQAL